MTSKADIPETVKTLYSVLHQLSAEEQTRAIEATLVLLGRSPQGAIQPHQSNMHQPISPLPTAPFSGTTAPTAGNSSAKEFFRQKNPQSKVEHFAVAARYRELFQGQESNSKDDLHAVFKEARINFDPKSYKRDMDNAKKQGFFNKGADNTLSLYAQNYVDALPDRAAVQNLAKPRIKKSKRTKPTKAVKNSKTSQ